MNQSINREFYSDLMNLAANLSYFSDIEIGRFMRKVLSREIKKGKVKDMKRYRNEKV